jgi:hypothetical protein
MRQTGAELIVLKPGEVTATQVQSENEANKCALQRICEIFEDGLDMCLQYMADWVGEADGGSVSLFTDFGAASLGEASAELLLKANQSGNISNETMFAEWKRRAILSPELEWEDEQDRIGTQSPALGMIEDEPATMPTTEPQEPRDYPASDLSAITDKLDALAAKVEMPQEAEIDLSPIQSQISALADQVSRLASMVVRPEPVDNSASIAAAITEAMRPIVEQLKPEESKPRTITITRDQSGQIIGAEVLH